MKLIVVKRFVMTSVSEVKVVFSGQREWEHMYVVSSLEYFNTHTRWGSMQCWRDRVGYGEAMESGSSRDVRLSLVSIRVLQKRKEDMCERKMDLCHNRYKDRRINLLVYLYSCLYR